MREPLGVTREVQWIRYTKNPDLLEDTPDATWVELVNPLEVQTREAIALTEPNC